MALAILELLAYERGQVRFKIDTGTNRYYRLKIGKNVRRQNGIDWVDEIIFASPMETNDAGGRVLNSAKEISISARHFEEGNIYAQLFSFKNREGRSPAFSRPVRVIMAAGVPLGPPVNYSPPFSLSTSMSMETGDTFQSARAVPCRSCREVYSQQASWEEILGGIVRIATPLVANLLRGNQSGPQPNAPVTPAPVATPPAPAVPGLAGGDAAQGDILSQLLRTFLGSAGLSQTHSLNGATRSNRFAGGAHARFSEPFFEPATLLALGTLAGSVAEKLPLLLNALNQQRLQMRQENNRLVSGIVSDVNRRMLLSQLVQAQQPGATVDINQLMQLLQQLPPVPAPEPAPAAPAPAPMAGSPAVPAPTPAPVVPAPAVPAPAPVTSEGHSLSMSAPRSFTLSSRAVVMFVIADPIAWNGAQKPVFAKNQGMQLKIQLKVAEPVPRKPLPKAILKFIFKDSSDQSIRFEKTFKQKDVLPNSPLAFSFAQAELSSLPVNKPIVVFAEMRWLNGKTGGESKAIGSTEIVLVNKYFMKEQGKAVSAEQELTDMKRFRPFWNKIWETASLAAAGRREKKYLWELDVDARYSVLLSAGHEENGLMETKIMRGREDRESLSDRTEGRLKAGIELSLAELNKLAPLWDGGAALDNDKLEAFRTDAFAQSNAGDFVSHFRLKGKARERGMVWVVPVFKLFEFTLNVAGKINEAGQVTGVTEEKVRFPLPVSARVIGLKAQS